MPADPAAFAYPLRPGSRGGIVSVDINLELPLPPSKNVAKVSKGRYIKSVGRYMNLKLNSEETDQYRHYTAAHVRAELYRLGSAAGAPLVFDPKHYVVIECHWRKPSDRPDCHNWHQELADMLQVALKVNDRRFLIRDISQTVCPGNPGVSVRLFQIERPRGRK